MYQIAASGCTGTYNFKYGGQIQPFTYTTPTSLTKTYTAAQTPVTETGTVESVDTAGKVLSTVSVVSTPAITITSPLSCSISPSATSLPIGVNGAGQVVQPVNVTLAVTTSVSGQVTAVTKNGAAVTGLTLPTPLSTTHSLVIPLNTVGAQALQVTSKATINAVDYQTTCSTSVTTTAQTFSAPTITSFAASPNPVAFGGTTTLNAVFAGNVTAVTIDGTNTAFANNQASKQVTPTDTGKKTATLNVAGPGGSAALGADYMVNPTCQVSTTALEGYVGNTVPISVNIGGRFNSATISGTGISQFSIAGSNTGFNQSVSVSVISASGPQDLVLNVVGPDGTAPTQVCKVNVNLMQHSPQIFVKLNGQAVTTIAVQRGTAVKFEWNAWYSTSCFVDDTIQVPVSGTNAFINYTNIQADQTHKIRCFGPTGLSGTVNLQINLASQWQAADREDCTAKCFSLGQTSLASPDGFKCASGEVRPQSGEGKITYTYGVIVPVMTSGTSTSFFGSCYNANQTKDADMTDYTVACYCK